MQRVQIRFSDDVYNILTLKAKTDGCSFKEIVEKCCNVYIANTEENQDIISAKIENLKTEFNELQKEIKEIKRNNLILHIILKKLIDEFNIRIPRELSTDERIIEQGKKLTNTMIKEAASELKQNSSGIINNFINQLK